MLPAGGGPVKRLALIMVAGGVLIAGVDVSYPHLEPLERGSRSSIPAGQLPEAFPGREPAYGEDVEIARYRFVPDTTFTFKQAIRNRGPLPITVDGVVIDRLDTDFLMEIIRAFDAGTTLETRSDPTVPFRPVTIASGDEAMIGIVGRTTDCAEATTNWEDGDSMSWSSIRVRYRLLFTAHERSVALATPIGILAPASDDCLGVGRPVSRLAPP